MRSELIRRFIQLGRRDEPMLWDQEIALHPREYYGYSRHIRCDHTMIFDIVQRSTTKIAGEIALRIGDSPEQFYLGHVGYHVDPPFRGNGYAAKACLLCEPLLVDIGLYSIVVTTDPDNEPSIRTCLRIGCQLECTVRVPVLVKNRLEISDTKNRYIWVLQQNRGNEVREQDRMF